VSRLSGVIMTSTPFFSATQVALNPHRLRTSQPLWLAMSIGKHRVGQPLPDSNCSRIHARLTGAGVICGALSRVMYPISRRAALLDPLIRGSLAANTRCYTRGHCDGVDPPDDRGAFAPVAGIEIEANTAARLGSETRACHFRQGDVKCYAARQSTSFNDPSREAEKEVKISHGCRG
jgi:hypothetical protein